MYLVLYFLSRANHSLVFATLQHRAKEMTMRILYIVKGCVGSHLFFQEAEIKISPNSLRNVGNTGSKIIAVPLRKPGDRLQGGDFARVCAYVYLISTFCG